MKIFKKAFTMIELVVSMAIITMLTVLFVANYHSNNKRTDLIMTAQELVANIHLAQNNALGLVQYGGVVPPGGWGVSFDKSTSTYVMFADLDEPNTNGYLEYNPDTEGQVQYGARTLELSPGIEISQLSTPEYSSISKANITFFPPDPQTNIYNVDNDATTTSLTIQLKETQNNTIKTIKVNFLGLVEVID